MSAQPCGCDWEHHDSVRGGRSPWFCKEHSGVGVDVAVGNGGFLKGVGGAAAGPLTKSSGLPDSDAARKALPIWTGFVMYFPDVLAAVAEVSKKGNDQHNPGEPLHWAREKSTDQMNTAMRHMLDHARGNRFDTDGSRHLAKAIWRLCAELQLDIEKGI